ncbi:MAG: hypothetical protein JRJ05_12185 [Deltaproteobacteria bacterium]|nr:hypothetical protein [Deltaproteobacteria bacterium]
MHAFSNLANQKIATAALALLVVLASALGCASKGCSRDDYRGVACRADEARESLSFGLSREAAIDTIGRSEVEPPWKNDLGLGPDVITNPFDSEIMKSPLGEEYEVVRFFVESSGNPECPFIQGKLRFQPLIFIDDKLVGWRWSYLADVLGERLSTKATRWSFGIFCDGRLTTTSNLNPPNAEPSEAEASDAEASESEPSEAAPSEEEPSNPDPSDPNPSKPESP